MLSVIKSVIMHGGVLLAFCAMPCCSAVVFFLRWRLVVGQRSASSVTLIRLRCFAVETSMILFGVCNDLAFARRFIFSFNQCAFETMLAWRTAFMPFFQAESSRLRVSFITHIRPWDSSSEVESPSLRMRARSIARHTN